MISLQMHASIDPDSVSRFIECLHLHLNSLPNDKIIDWSKLTALTDNKINVTQLFKFVLRRVENIVEKGENAG